jgi:hypothetical protein
VRQIRRESYLDPLVYREEFGEITSRIRKVTAKIPAQIEPGVAALFVAAQQRLWDAMDFVSLQYSAGAPVEQIREVWPYAMRWAEEFAMFHEAHHRDPKTHQVVPHAALRTEDYWTVALRLLCFGVLTGYANEMPRLMRFVDYGNDLMGVRDGLIERLVRPFVQGRGEPPDEATRHLPYRKLFKVFAAEPDTRPVLMAKYLDGWYHASRREPYIDQHLGGGVNFYGYWSWESAAVTWLLGIDDNSYRDMPFYPRDLADYAKAHAGSPAAPVISPPAPLRCEGGQPCPREGWWFTPAKVGSRRHFEQGETMPVFATDYGATIWQWDERQDGSQS